MAKIPIRGEGPWAILEAPFVAEELRYGAKARRGVPSRERLERAEKSLGVPYSELLKKYQKGAPAGPASALAGSILGIGTGALTAAGGASVGGPVGGFAGGTAGYMAGSYAGRKLLEPLDKKIFAKQLERTGKIKTELEKYRGV